MKDRTLVEVGPGQVPESHKGHFTVKYGKRHEEPFTDYAEALRFYEGLVMPAALWDITHWPELCHRKQYAA